jgi:ferredoxin
MKVHVDKGTCQNYGQCVFAAPDVFDLDDTGELVYESNPSDATRTDVDAAVMACPVQAITVPDGN